MPDTYYALTVPRMKSTACMETSGRAAGLVEEVEVGISQGLRMGSYRGLLVGWAREGLEDPPEENLSTVISWRNSIPPTEVTLLSCGGVA